jgi:GlpG protein
MSTASTDFPLLTTLQVAFSVVFTASYWLQSQMPDSPLSAISHMALPTPSEVWSGHYKGLFLSIFPHADVIHILFNMLWLWRIGMVIEKEVHPLAYVGFVLASAFVGSTCELAISSQTGIGMSGVVYAMFGLVWAGRGHSAAWRQIATRENLNLFLGWGVLCIVLTALKYMTVANGAHFGGLLFGLCVGGLFYSPRKNLAFIPLMVAQLALCFLVLFYVPWSGDWHWYAGNKDYDAKRYVKAGSHYEMALKLSGDDVPLLGNLSLAYLQQMREAANRNDEAEVKRLSQQIDKVTQRLDAISAQSKKSGKSGKGEQVTTEDDAGAPAPGDKQSSGSDTEKSDGGTKQETAPGKQ